MSIPQAVDSFDETPRELIRSIASEYNSLLNTSLVHPTGKVDALSQPVARQMPSSGSHQAQPWAIETKPQAPRTWGQRLEPRASVVLPGCVPGSLGGSRAFSFVSSFGRTVRSGEELHPGSAATCPCDCWNPAKIAPAGWTRRELGALVSWWLRLVDVTAPRGMEEMPVRLTLDRNGFGSCGLRACTPAAVAPRIRETSLTCGTRRRPRCASPSGGTCHGRRREPA